jgi:hypothetical protein
MYLFFTRHFNDIDHLTPIVWKLKKDNHPVAVYSMNPQYDIHNDYRLQFLKNKGVTVDYLHDALDQDQGMFYKIRNKFIQKCSSLYRILEGKDGGLAGKLSSKIGQIARRLMTVSYKNTRKIYYDNQWAQSILERTGAQVICFDHIMPKLFVVDALLTASRQMSIPSLALPHGVHLYTNEETKPKATVEHRLTKFNRFDYIIVTNELHKSLLTRTGVAEDKIFVLGSTRYCSEWLEQNRKILPGNFNAAHKDSGKLKVVLMPSKPQCRMDVERLFETCRILADIEGVEAMFKPHTRLRSQGDVFDNIPLPDVSSFLTAELCDWADVLLNVGSSVITDGLMRGKPVLYLKYLHDNTTLFEELGACWTIHDEVELKDALSTLQMDKNHMPYSKEGVASFLTKIVKGGDGARDVLGTYEQFIMDCAAGGRPAQGKYGPAGSGSEPRSQ